VGPDGGFQEARDPGPDRPADDGAHDADEHMQRPRHPHEDVPQVERGQKADEILALTADVEHPAAEGERDRERGEDERRRDDQRLLEVERRAEALVALHPREEPVEPRTREDRLVRGERVVSRRDHHEAADEEGEDRSRHGREEAAEA
jgi:hypothetical protein